MFLICKLTGAFGRKSVMIWQKYGVIQNVHHSGKRGGKTDKKSNKKLRRGRVHSQKNPEIMQVMFLLTLTYFAVFFMSVFVDVISFL